MPPESPIPLGEGTLLSELETPERSEPTGPTPVARYSVEHPVGAGGMGEVEAVRDHLLGRTVARKRLRTERAGSPGHAELLWEEARTTAGLEHPGIVSLYDAGVDDRGEAWFTMRYVRGQTLAEALAGLDRPADRQRLIGRLLAAVEAVAFAHSRGVIHNDLKPSNIVCGPYGETVVIDWGLARAPDRDPQARGGTRAYMSPERLAGQPADAAADTWALGASLYELLTGAPPPPPPLDRPSLERWWAERAAAPALREQPPDLAAIALHALRPDPARRYAQAGALAEELRSWTEGRFVGVHSYGPRQALALLARRHRLAVRVGSFALLAILAVGLVGWRSTALQAERARQEAVLARAAEAEASASLARLLVAEASQAVGQGRFAEVELLAARALGLGEDVRARGLLWTAALHRRPAHAGRLAAPAGCAELAVSGDGALLACLEAEALSLWQPATGALRWRKAGRQRSVGFVGPFLMLRGPDLVPRLWSTEGVAMGSLYSSALPTAGTVVASADGGRVAFAVGAERVVAEGAGGSPQRLPGCAEGAISAMGAGPALEPLLYTCDLDGRLYGGEVEQALPVDAPTFLLADPQGSRFLLGTRSSAALLLDGAGRPLHRREGSLSGSLRGAWSGDGQLAALVGDEPGAWLLNAQGQDLGRLPARAGALVGAGPAPGSLLTATAEGSESRLDQWVDPGPAEGALLRAEVGLSDGCASPDGERLALARSDGRLELWSRAGSLLGEASWQHQVVKRCAFSPDGRLLAAVGMEVAAVQLFDGEDLRPLGSLPVERPVRLLAFVEGGRQLLALSYGVGGQLFAIPSGGAIARLPEPLELIALGGGAGEEPLVGLGHEGTLYRYDPTAMAFRTLAEQPGAFALAAGGGRLAVLVGPAGELRLDPLEPAGPQALGSSDATRISVALSPDGRWLATGHLDGAVELWDLEAGQRFARTPPTGKRLPDLEFVGGGRWLSGAGWDGALRLWPMEGLDRSPEEWQAQVRRRWGLGEDEPLVD